MWLWQARIPSDDPSFCLFVFVYLYLYLCICICVFAYLFICIFVYLYLCICVFVFFVFVFRTSIHTETLLMILIIIIIITSTRDMFLKWLQQAFPPLTLLSPLSAWVAPRGISTALSSFFASITAITFFRKSHTQWMEKRKRLASQVVHMVCFFLLISILQVVFAQNWRKSFRLSFLWNRQWFLIKSGSSLGFGLEFPPQNLVSHWLTGKSPSSRSVATGFFFNLEKSNKNWHGPDIVHNISIAIVSWVVWYL